MGAPVVGVGRPSLWGAAAPRVAPSIAVPRDACCVFPWQAAQLAGLAAVPRPPAGTRAPSVGRCCSAVGSGHGVGRPLPSAVLRHGRPCRARAAPRPLSLGRNGFFWRRGVLLPTAKLPQRKGEPQIAPCSPRESPQIWRRGSVPGKGNEVQE